jgi:hypothetical protein
MVDRALQRRYAMDSPGAGAGAGGQQDLDKLDAIEARRQVKRPVQVAA